MLPACTCRCRVSLEALNTPASPAVDAPSGDRQVLTGVDQGQLLLHLDERQAGSGVAAASTNSDKAQKALSMGLFQAGGTLYGQPNSLRIA